MKPRSMYWWYRIFLLFICCALVVASGHAQSSSGSISGAIYDESGAAIDGATVVVTNEATGIATTVRTNGEGIFVVVSLPAGKYTMAATKGGFRRLDVAGIQLDPGQQINRNLTLKVGETGQTVTVTTSPTQINTASGEVSGTIESQQIERIDVNGHNYQSLLSLVPGMNNTKAGSQLSGLGLNNGFVISSNGLAVNKNVSMIDGSFNLNLGSANQGSVNPEPNTIGEMRVMADNYSALYGYAGGAQFLLELKSGQRDFHGTAQEYVRNDAFDARNYFAQSVSPLKQNVFGFTIGGPLFIPHLYNTKRDKTFFFWGQNWRVVHQGQTLLGSTPTDLMRQGNFQQEAVRTGQNIVDPTTGQPFPNNIIPSNRIDASALALMNYLLPLPNNPAGGFLNYLNDIPDRTTQQQEVVRIDHAYSDKFHILFHYIQEDVKDIPPNVFAVSSPFATIGSQVHTYSKNAYISFVNILGPSAVNEFGFSYAQINISAYPTGHAYLPSGLSIPGYFPGANPTNYVPDLNFGGGYSFVGVNWMNSLANAPDMAYTFTDKVSKVVRSHNLTAGIFYNIGVASQNYATSIQGSYGFSGVSTNNPIADFLLGYASSYGQASVMRDGHLRYVQVEPYIQDDWKLNRRLTLNLGLRYSYIPPWYLQEPVTTFVPSAFNPAHVPEVTTSGILIPTPSYDPQNGLVYAGERLNGVTPGFSKLQEDLFAPRLGFAWDVWGDGKTAIRGGFGITYTRTGDQVWGTLSNPPFTQTVSLSAVPFGNPTEGVANPMAPPSIALVPLDTVPMRVNSYSIGAERQLGSNALLRISYVGNKTSHTPWGRDINQVVPTSSGGFDPRLNSNTISVNALRPYQGYAAISGTFSDGHGSYNSLQINFVHRYTNNLSLQAAYTYSKSLGEGTDYGGSPQNIYNLAAEYGPSSKDRTHMLNIGYVYDLPFFVSGNTAAKAILGGWGMSGMASINSGFPATVSLATATPGLAKRPNIVHKGSTHGGSATQWFDTSAFAAPAPGSYGDAGIGGIRAPGLVDWDLSLVKRTPLVKDRLNSEFRASFYNVLNHTNFAGVSTAFGSGNFGSITSALDPRIMEFGLKVMF